MAGLRPGSVLELGCGLGSVGVRLAQMAGSYTAVEPDEKSWSVAHERISPLGGTVIHGDHSAAPQGSGYDLVCAFEVLEHIEDDKAALAQWLPLVRPGGHLLLSVPGDPARFGPYDTLVGHFRRYTPAGLEQRLAEAGAVDIDVRHYGWPLTYATEAVRNRLAKPKLDRAVWETAEERTSGSGRQLQPSTRLLGTAIRVGIAPFIGLQSLRPMAGPDLVVLGRRPA
ncbi:MAG: class I SAM-dependent methyltransferase [Micromonosporaceae bacterium]|nr:class I SAM-dependent methyltransferase [Micromonosporaceae bacterium]